MPEALPLLVVVGGPTASGKTALAVHLASAFKTEVISADSPQFYREMRIGTARPDAAELKGIPHHFLGHRSIHEPYTAGQYETDALKVLQDVFSQRNVAVMAGGTGLYIKAVCEGLDNLPHDLAVRKELSREWQDKGLAWLQREMEQRDPAYYATADTQNHVRLLRAMEVMRISGEPYSTQRKGVPVERSFRQLHVALNWPRNELYHRIDQRVDGMMRQGLLEEAQNLFPYRNLNALQTVGYRELFSHFDGLYNLDVAVERIKQHTRNYAKRQLTWLRNQGQTLWFEPEHSSQLTEKVMEMLYT